MTSNFKSILLALIGMLAVGIGYAQTEPAADESYPEYLDSYAMEAQLRAYIYDLDLIAMEIPIAGKARLQNLASACQRLDAKCSLYTQTNQDVIATEETLIDLVGQYKERFTLITDSIQNQIDRSAKLSTFANIEKSLEGKDTAYMRMIDEARMLSLTSKTSSMLAALKKKEATMRQEIDNQYATAAEIAAANPFLKTRMQALSDKYNAIALDSDQVQAAEYKSFFDRIKDYLYGFAAVALILMFFNAFITKIKAAKQLREQAKQFKESIRQNNNDYPTI